MSSPRGDWSYSPALHYRQAARWQHIPWHVFTNLPDDEQAGYIAHYEAIMTLEALDAAELRGA